MPDEHDIGSLSSILQAQGLTLVHITSHQSSEIENTKEPDMDENHPGIQGNEIVAYTETPKDMKKLYTDVNAPPSNCSNKRLKTSMASNTSALPQPDTVDSKSCYHTQELNHSKGESKSQILQLSNDLPQQNQLSLTKTSTLRCEESKNANYEKNAKKESSTENDKSFPRSESKVSDEKIDEKTVTVDLPLAGPFVHGYLSGVEEVVECYNGDYESILHEVTSKFLFEISRNGGKIESQKDVVTFPLSETEAIANVFIQERHETIKEAIRVTFIETQNKHLEIMKEARKKFEQCFKDILEERDKEYLELEKKMKEKYEKDIEELRKEHDEELLEAVNMHEKEIKEMKHLMKDQKKAHKRSLAAYLSATQITFQRFKDEFALDLD